MEKYFNILLKKAVAKQILVKYSYKKIDGAALSLLVEAFSFLLLRFLKRVNRGTLYAKRSRTTVVDLMNILEIDNIFIDFNFTVESNSPIYYTCLYEFNHEQQLPAIHTYEKTKLEIDYYKRDNQIKRRQQQSYLVRKNLLSVIEEEGKEKKHKFNFIFE